MGPMGYFDVAVSVPNFFHASMNPKRSTIVGPGPKKTAGAPTAAFVAWLANGA